MSFHIFDISVPSDSWCCCSSISHHFIQFHAAEWDNADIIRFFFLRSDREFAGSQSFHYEISRVMDRNGGRRCAVLTHWKCWISYIHFCRWLPNYTLAVRVTCHLKAATILSVQRRGPISILLFDYYANHRHCPQHHGLLMPLSRQKSALPVHLLVLKDGLAWCKTLSQQPTTFLISFLLMTQGSLSSNRLLLRPLYSNSRLSGGNVNERNPYIIQYIFKWQVS